MKILVGLSGGVDSAVAAYLLKEQGHEVECAFMRNWDSLTNNDILGNPTLDEAICTQEQDYNDAVEVAKKLGLPLHRIDFINEYWDDVFQTFLKEYARGRTPNPDILCNKFIKFDAFFKFAQERGFEYVATGHYARVKHHSDHSEMLKAVDANKDQSYFLCQVNQDALQRTFFPLGELEKPEVRAIALKLELNVAKKKDSTGICFIGERRFTDFLKQYLPAQPGVIETVDGVELSQHSGLMYHTIGQRQGLGIGGLKNASEEAWYVLAKDLQRNVLIVGQGNQHPWLFSRTLLTREVNWINPVDLNALEGLTAKVRYRQSDQACSIEHTEDGYLVTFEQPQRAVTLGQSIVFYNGDVCLGGGVIEACSPWDESIQRP